MTKEVIEMAEQCGIDPHDMCEDPRIAINNLEAFAKLVAAKEREACAKVCDNFSAHYWAKDDAIESVIYEECATAIRARGEA